MAELLSTRRRRKCGNATRYEPRHGAYGSNLQPLRRPPGTCFRRWPQAHGSAFLYQLRRVETGRREKEVTTAWLTLIRRSRFRCALRNFEFLLIRCVQNQTLEIKHKRIRAGTDRHMAHKIHVAH